MNRFCFFLVAVGCIAAGSASAQTVYRCGSEYTRVPCAEGRLIDVSDPVTPERRAEAREAARREQRLGEAMARERRAEAAAYRPALAANIGPVKPAAPAPTPQAKKKSKAKKRLGEPVDGVFVARVPKAKALAG
jgi:hypothetical protein